MLRRWTWFFLFSAAHVGLAGWTFAGPPVVGKWAAGFITMINQFKAGNGARASPHCSPVPARASVTWQHSTTMSAPATGPCMLGTTCTDSNCWRVG